MPVNYGAELENTTTRHRENAPSNGGKKQLTIEERETSEGVHLRKEIGLLSAVALNVGVMIGSGIFISPKTVLLRSGSVGASLIIWAACGLVSLITGLCYLELGTMIPYSGGSYIYLLECFGKSEKHKFLGPLPAFLYVWITIILTGPNSCAIIILTFAEYAMSPFFDDCEAPRLLVKLCAICAIVFLTIVNCYNVKAMTIIMEVFMFAKIVPLVVIIVGGIINLAKGYTENLQNSFEGTTSSPGEIALALYGGLWAYSGFHSVNIVMDEVKNPSRNLPGAMIIGVPLVIVLYLLTNISYFTVMSKEELLASPAVAMTWGDAMLGVMSWIMPLSVAISTLGSAGCMSFRGPRLCWAAAKRGHFYPLLSYLSINNFTPIFSLLFYAAIVIILIILSDTQSLISFFGFASGYNRGLAMFGLILMRWTRPNLKRPVKVPIVLAVFSLMFSIFIVVTPIIEDPQLPYLYAALIYIGGVVIYTPFVYFKIRLKCIDAVTVWCQTIFEVVPPEMDGDNCL